MKRYLFFATLVLSLPVVALAQAASNGAWTDLGSVGSGKAVAFGVSATPAGLTAAEPANELAQKAIRRLVFTKGARAHTPGFQARMQQLATADNWIGGIGNWSKPTNWSLGVPPGSGNDVSISSPSGTVSLDINGAINNLTMGSTSTLTILDNLALTIDGNSIINSNHTGSGGIILNSGNSPTALIVGNPTVTLTGGGTITLSNNNANYIYGTFGTNVLTNADNTIQGSGNIGLGKMGLINQGTIDANQYFPLRIQTSNGTTNTGTLEATAGGTLILMADTFTNTGGTILASGSDSVVGLQNATINGGTLNGFGGGSIQGWGDPTLNGVSNTGTYQVPDSNSTTLMGTINNSGTIQLNSGNSPTQLILGSTGVTLTGGGTVTLSNNAANYILGAAAADALTNVNNTIQGSGNIGHGQMALVNQSTIDANQSTPLYVQTSNGTTNTGTLEATAGGTLVLYGDAYTNAGGTILASGGNSVVVLQNSTINGGTLNTASGGLIQGWGDPTLNGVTNTGTYQVPDNNSTTLVGTITNNGAIQLNSGNSPTTLYASGAVTLQGGGTVMLSNNNANYITQAASGGSLTNVNNTISGSGNIGNNSLAFTNQPAGVVDATAGFSLVINPGAPGGVNAGMFEASNGGMLVVENAITNWSGTTNGTIEALDGGTAVLYGASVGGGTLTTAGTGVVLAEAGAQLDGSTKTIANAGNLQVPDNNTLYLKGTLNNTGTLLVNSGNSATALSVNSPTATLQGSGTVTLSDNNGNFISAATAGNQLINQQTIQGAGGNIGDGNLVIVNQGTIDATASAHGNGLTVQPGGSLTNTGLLEATGGGSLGLYGGTFVNTGGTITAGSGSNVYLEGGATINGGTLNGAGLFTSYTGTTLNGVTNAGTLQVPNNSSTTLAGTIANTGSLQLNSGNNATLFYASGAVTLTGGGAVTLSNNPANYITQSASGGSLTNVDNTISGSGNIGNGALAFTNQAAGVVDAAPGFALYVNPGAAGAVNQGIFEASSGGTLVLDDSIANTGGVIEALAGTGSNAGGTVVLNGATITGGTLNTLGSGVNAGSMIAQGNAVLNNVTNNGTIQIPNAAAAGLEGTVTNNGSIQVNSGNNTTVLYIHGNTTLNGTGTIAISTNWGNYVEGVTGSEVLTNNGNTIEGSSYLGYGNLGLVNNGTVLANQGTPLVVYTNSSGFTNNGIVQVSEGSLLNITGGPFTNFNGTTGTLTGGTYNVGGTLEFDNANIATNAANITLTGAGSQIISNTSANALANFATNAAGGSFTLGDGRSFTTGGNFTNNGALTVGGGDTFKVAGSLTNFAGSTLTGGTYNVSGTLQFGAGGSSLTTNAANLTLNGAGAKLIDLGGNNLLSGFNTNAAGGAFTVAGGDSFTTAGAFTNAGMVDLEQASKLTVSGNLANSGTLATNNTNLQGGANTLTVTGTLTNNSGGTVTIGANNNTADTASAGLLSNAGTLTVDTGAFLKLTKAGANVNSGTLTLNGGTITGVGSLRKLTNTKIIQGGGTLSNFGIINAGTLLANQSTPLIILPTTAGLNNKGTLSVSAGDTMRIGTSAGNALVNFAGNTLTGGTYNIGGTLQFGASGATLATNAANITLTGAGAQMIDFANHNILAGFTNNAAAGVFKLAAGASLTTTGGSFINTGLFTVSAGTTFTVGGSSFNFTQTAGTTMVNGTLTSTTLGTLAVNGGSLFGGGTLGYNVVDAGILSPGNSVATTGRLTVADTYTQTGVLDIQINGAAAATQYDQLKVTKSATLGGTLNISLGTGFTPTVGETFTILTASKRIGTFAAVNGLTINASEYFLVTYKAGSVVLTVKSGTPPASGVTLTQLIHPPVNHGSGAKGHYGPAVNGKTIAQLPAVVPAVSATRTTGMRGFRPMDQIGLPVAVSAPVGTGDANRTGSLSIAPASAAAYNSMSGMNHLRFECGVDLKALLKTSRKQLLKGLWAAPDSPDAVAIGYMTYSGAR